MHDLARTLTVIARKNPESEIWYDLACAAVALDLWGTDCLAKDEGRVNFAAAEG